MSELQIPKKIVWLASYPKSGNTWFRAFLTALLNDGKVDINDLETDGIFSSRVIFENRTDLPSEFISREEVQLLYPAVFNAFSGVRFNKKVGNKLFVKIHDAYILNKNNKPIVPTESTFCGLYFIRHPFDVAVSYANHLQVNVDDVINHWLNNNNANEITHHEKSSKFFQFNQLLMNWSNHVESWTSIKEFPVMVIRYEDMLSNSFEIFKNAVEFSGLNFEVNKILEALEAAQFKNLKAQEEKNSFHEKNTYQANFFYNGKSGLGNEVLTSEQKQIIIQHHHKIMTLYDYL